MSVFRNKGFSLLQILVAVNIMAIISVFAMSSVVNIAKMQKGISRTERRQDISNEIYNLFQNEDQCTCNFRHIQFPTNSIPTRVDITDLRYFNDTLNCTRNAADRLLLVSATEGQSHKIQELFLFDIVRAFGQPKYTGRLYVRYNFGSNNSINSKTIIDSFLINFEATISGGQVKLERCIPD